MDRKKSSSPRTKQSIKNPSDKISIDVNTPINLALLVNSHGAIQVQVNGGDPNFNNIQFLNLRLFPNILNLNIVRLSGSGEVCTGYNNLNPADNIAEINKNPKIKKLNTYERIERLLNLNNTLISPAERHLIYGYANDTTDHTRTFVNNPEMRSFKNDEFFYEKIHTQIDNYGVFIYSKFGLKPHIIEQINKNIEILNGMFTHYGHLFRGQILHQFSATFNGIDLPKIGNLYLIDLSCNVIPGKTNARLIHLLEERKFAGGSLFTGGGSSFTKRNKTIKRRKNNKTTKKQ